MSRPVLEEDKLHPAIRSKVAYLHSDIVADVRRAIAENDVVVVGMAQNPYPKKARALLTDRRIAFKYLEYGSYLNTWRRRAALKMWTGWPTFPMIFIKGMLIGGASDLKSLAESGELDELLSRSSSM